ncbi:MAG TPA: Asp-tRNA(Asn)/Glu-tRNA(Gln) amidotransferase subunit GatB [Candidatus Latescibacteria bacterium]|nr:Asp-tRNA(Asn)/Glu-tRNA(Gln) amidotransferase subunit GatB [Candidatus Latescibacterota bacterium]
MSNYRVVIGLEIHLQLATKTKVFCGCSNEFGGEPNTHSCPVCLGMPGVLPVFNRQVLEYALRLACALGSRVSERCRFVRKNYFYPDLPKGYQISQFHECLAYGGAVEIDVSGTTKRICLDRIQIEEDAGKSLHSEDSHMEDTLVDVNRCGTPLLEIISKPTPGSPDCVYDPSAYLNSPDEAIAYWVKLRQLTRYLGISECNMEEGNMRADANISIWDEARGSFGTKTEIKNLNSFKFAHRALTQEIARHIEILSAGGKVKQETMLYDSSTDTVAPMRSKEEAHDYRYFPEPDLVPVVVTEEFLAQVRKNVPELPDARKKRFVSEFGLNEDAADLLSAERALADYFEGVVRSGAEPRTAANWVMGDVLRETNTRKMDVSVFPVSPPRLAELIALVASGTINQNVAKDVFAEMVDSGKQATQIVEARGLAQISDRTALAGVVAEVMGRFPGEIQRFRAGEVKLMGFFVGQVMKATKGRANPALVNDLVREYLS